LVLFLIGLAHSATGKIIYVDADATGANNGTSWAYAYKYLQDALADANSAEKPVEIRVARGMYRPDRSSTEPNGTGDREATFQLINGVTIKGGYAGAPDPNLRNIELYETILSGDLANDDIEGLEPSELLNHPSRRENSYHIFYHPKGLNLDVTAILDGFTITCGNANIYDWPHRCGGGMFNDYYSSPTVTNCTFSGNSAYYGGGMYNYSYSSPKVNNCAFSGNSAYYRGGGMVNDNSSPTVTNCTFTANSANYGGGMCNNYSRPTVTNCTFTANSASDGGGMRNWYYSRPSVTNCTFTANSANYGGGMCNYIYSNPKVNNCTFSGNSAVCGGGMYNYRYSSPNVNNCTFTANSSKYYGGGIYNLIRTYRSPTVTNCILWADVPSEIYGGTTTVRYSDVQGGWPGEGNIDKDPCFVKPGYWDANGVWIDGDYHLLPDSLCIDAGMDAGVYTDIEGNVRPFDYPGVDNNGELPEFDMGAYEMLPWVKVPMKFTPQALNCNSKGKWVKAHFVLPAEFTVGDVDANSPAKIEPLGIESDYMNVFINEDGLVEVEAAFERAAFCDAAGCGSIEMTVVGLLTNGQYFYGTDTIEIIKNSLECLAVLSSRWLEMNCGKPDWCNGFDADQDTTVNLKDFAIIALHWLEVRD